MIKNAKIPSKNTAKKIANGEVAPVLSILMIYS
jgi:hypothetical protein